MRVRRSVRRGVTLSAAVMALLSFIPAAATSASASVFGCDGYLYAGDHTNNAANEGVYGDIRAEGETYGGDSGSHMAAWVGSNTPAGADVSSPYDQEDWVQGGYAIGDLDGVITTDQVMYAEFTGPGYGPTPNYFPQYGLGNQFFESTITSTTSGSYGLYYMFDNSTEIASSWLINPTDTYQDAVLESYSASVVAACPVMTDGLFGTTGSNDSYNESSEIAIIRHSYVTDLWQSEISTYEYEGSPYTAAYWVNYSAFHSYGG
jgi:hypothetical protein